MDAWENVFDFWKYLLVHDLSHKASRQFMHPAEYFMIVADSLFETHFHVVYQIGFVKINKLL